MFTLPSMHFALKSFNYKMKVICIYIGTLVELCDLGRASSYRSCLLLRNNKHNNVKHLELN